MTEQEIFNNQIKTKVEIQDEKFNSFLREMHDFKQEMKDFKHEMRDRDNQRHAEIIEIRQSVQSIQESSRNQTIVTFLGIAAMVIAVLLK